MNGSIIGFVIWAIVGCIMIAFGIHAFVAKKPVGFWANAETMKVNDVKGYNRATGKLFVAYGLIFILLGLPMLGEQNNALILVSVLGVMFETVAMMGIYVLYIEKKYRAKP